MKEITNVRVKRTQRSTADLTSHATPITTAQGTDFQPVTIEVDWVSDDHGHMRVENILLTGPEGGCHVCGSCTLRRVWSRGNFGNMPGWIQHCVADMWGQLGEWA